MRRQSSGSLAGSNWLARKVNRTATRRVGRVVWMCEVAEGLFLAVRVGRGREGDGPVSGAERSPRAVLQQSEECPVEWQKARSGPANPHFDMMAGIPD